MGRLSPDWLEDLKKAAPTVADRTDNPSDVDRAQEGFRPYLEGALEDVFDEQDPRDFGWRPGARASRMLGDKGPDREDLRFLRGRAPKKTQNEL